MKYLLLALSVSFGFLTMVACHSKSTAESHAVELFNGENLDGWSFLSVDPSVTKPEVWSVKDGVMVCKGEPLGYLYTQASYQDFTLRFDWRWAPGTEAGNSGVLLRIAGEPATFMPKCVEAQLKHQSAGDVWAFYGANVAGTAERLVEVKDHEKLGNFKGYKKIQIAENPIGEWNHYEIHLAGESMTLKVNGKAVNEVTGLDITPGPIGFQSEGGEIHFRNIEITSDDASDS